MGTPLSMVHQNFDWIVGFLCLSVLIMVVDSVCYTVKGLKSMKLQDQVAELQKKFFEKEGIK